METDLIITSCCTSKRTLPNDFTSEASVNFMPEIRRLASFLNCELNLPLTISKGHLAKTGLAYDQNEHKLKCAACKFEFDLNEKNINPIEQHLKQNPECKLALIQNEIIPQLGQLPIGMTSSVSKIELCNSNDPTSMEVDTNSQNKELSLQRAFLDKLSDVVIRELQTNTFSNWPLIAPNAQEMINAGWSYTNITDRVVCLYCNTIFHKWTADDQPYEIHRLKSPQCPFVLSYEKHNSSKYSSQIAISALPNVQAVVGAVNNEYSQSCRRHESFQNWPHTEENPLPSVESFVNAGFYYTGVKTIVRCFYCNNALQNWQPNDDPKIEHARFYPQCAYIRQYIGEELYQAVLHKTRELNAQNASQISKPEKKLDIALWSDDELDRMVKARLDLPIVEKVRELGFKIAVIRKALEMQLRFKKDDFKTDNDFRYACLILNAQVVLINGMSHAVLVPQEWMKNFTNNPEMNIQQTNQSVTQTSQISDEKIEASNSMTSSVPQSKPTHQPDDDSILCVLCLQTERQVACLPCGHLTSCVACGHSLRVCPICRTPVKAFVRIYV
ncbi:unnamed protein product [Adineta ricciae]|uniref:RING-type domain-containing protein n=1 Tax=Adineta ricciae TaxID=249248 RepID=A0A815AYV6_ADIRI|nr:unnamed protein product [Adineta ricciae]CAF1263086.1 unnamed protein product [Adineta ricciae]